MFSISLRKHLRPLLEFAPLIYAFNIYTYIYSLFLNHTRTALRTTQLRWEAKSGYCYSNQKCCPITLIISARYLESHSELILDIWKQFQRLQEDQLFHYSALNDRQLLPLPLNLQTANISILKTLTSQEDPIANSPVVFAYYHTSFTARNQILIWQTPVKKHHKINYSFLCPPQILLC